MSELERRTGEVSALQLASFENPKTIHTIVSSAVNKIQDDAT